VKVLEMRGERDKFIGVFLKQRQWYIGHTNVSNPSIYAGPVGCRVFVSCQKQPRMSSDRWAEDRPQAEAWLPDIGGRIRLTRITSQIKEGGWLHKPVPCRSVLRVPVYA
jgi:hypothetical protein